MPICRRKVTVLGAGNVGATAAQRIAEAGIADVYLVDVVDGLPQGKALDLVEAAPLQHHDQMIYGTNDYSDTTESDVDEVQPEHSPYRCRRELCRLPWHDE